MNTRVLLLPALLLQRARVDGCSWDSMGGNKAAARHHLGVLRRVRRKRLPLGRMNVHLGCRGRASGHTAAGKGRKMPIGSAYVSCGQTSVAEIVTLYAVARATRLSEFIAGGVHSDLAGGRPIDWFGSSVLVLSSVQMLARRKFS